MPIADVLEVSLPGHWMREVPRPQLIPTSLIPLTHPCLVRTSMVAVMAQVMFTSLPMLLQVIQNQIRQLELLL